MYRHRIAWLAYTAGLLASTAHAQTQIVGSGGGWGGWIPDQANSTLCLWDGLRVATLKDVVYLDGGNQQLVAGMVDGKINTLIGDDNPLGLIWTYNFSTPFNENTNFSTILGTLSKAPGGGAANNFAPNFHDGALLANNDEFYLYGGTLKLTGEYSAPDGGSVLGYMKSEYGENGRAFLAGFRNEDLPDDMTRYVTFGAAAGAPSENRSWYFGGYRSASWGPIYDPINSTYNPSSVSNTFITLDMTTQQQEVWKNVTLPNGTQSRAGPSMVWVPVGEQGILVVLGGVTYPNYDNQDGESQNVAQNEKDSPGFMSTIDVYDVAGDKWYRQPTQGAPPALTRGCAVVATASDHSSFNIYYYGGYDGLNVTSDFNDDVWILTLPTFMWMKVTSGTTDHARAGHQCVMPYPDQMITIGGAVSKKGGSVSNCLSGDNPSMFQAYNLTAGKWMDSYDPNSWNEYGVPEMIHMMVGGDYSGGATITAPTPGGWATPSLGSVFATPYDASKLTSFYPYSSMGPGNGTRGEAHSGGGGGTPGWVGAVLGVVLGLVFVTAVVVGIILYRRRKLLKRNPNGQPPTDENGRKDVVASWIQNLQSNSKAPTVTTDDTRTQYDDMESRGVSPGHPEMRMISPTEMPDTPLVELWDTSRSPYPELSGDTGSMHHTGLAHIVDMKHSPFASNPQTPRSITSQSPFSGTASHDHASSISSQGPPPPRYTQRPDSPPLGTNDAQFGSIAGIASGSSNANSNSDIPSNISSSAANNTGGAERPRPAVNPNRNTVMSGVSGLSDRDAGHLRQISDTTVSSVNADESHPHQRDFAQSTPPLLVSPPSVTTVDNGATDYISHQHSHSRSIGNGGSGNASSPHRQSIFVENEDDLGPTPGEAR
ncbi:hypothetical protein F4781DRAFT_262285 [Annulohypoxylon bovei var. microspora]|nr:hypothetical protein F4781DRAFT_262285 [Annulohypoxylon bovei var. microspora]